MRLQSEFQKMVSACVNPKRIGGGSFSGTDGSTGFLGSSGSTGIMGRRPILQEGRPEPTSSLASNLRAMASNLRAMASTNAFLKYLDFQSD